MNCHDTRLWLLTAVSALILCGSSIADDILLACGGSGGLRKNLPVYHVVYGDFRVDGDGRRAEVPSSTTRISRLDSQCVAYRGCGGNTTDRLGVSARSSDCVDRFEVYNGDLAPAYSSRIGGANVDAIDAGIRSAFPSPLTLGEGNGELHGYDISSMLQTVRHVAGKSVNIKDGPVVCGHFTVELVFSADGNPWTAAYGVAPDLDFLPLRVVLRSRDQPVTPMLVGEAVALRSVSGSVTVMDRVRVTRAAGSGTDLRELEILEFSTDPAVATANLHATLQRDSRIETWTGDGGTVHALESRVILPEGMLEIQ